MYRGERWISGYFIIFSFGEGRENNHRIDHICDKDDVEEILLSIYNDLGLTLSVEFSNRFAELLNSSTNAIHFQEWDDLAYFIDN